MFVFVTVIYIYDLLFVLVLEDSVSHEREDRSTERHLVDHAGC